MYNEQPKNDQTVKTCRFKIVTPKYIYSCADGKTSTVFTEGRV